ncbi:MAG: glycoside hydrolase family 3 C-terminal domain-containing protein [Armatimonadetes bacterium]|nr:glycoside hydrolase family 3 C-terminal domain-containing protein [Armatimonadota bacterium]
MTHLLRTPLHGFITGALAVTLAWRVAGAQVPLYRDPRAPIEQRVEDLLARMTLEEKVAQLGGDESGMSTPDNERLGIPGFKMSDGPHGCRWGRATCFPTLLACAATFDPDFMRRMGVALGEEFRGHGRYVALGPCMNIIRDPRGGRSFETLGEDPYLLSRMAVAYVQGMQSQRVVAVCKHYACNNQENGRGENDVRVGDRTLYEFYLPHFRAAVVEGGALGIMAAYNKVNGYYCAANRRLLREILKDEWGFRGFVVSDWGACHETVGSINAGLDCEMPTAYHYGERLLEAVRRGEVSEETINDAVRRVLYVKFWAGVFEQPVEPDPTKIDTPEHRALCLEGARKAIVLLKNEGGLLPLDRTKIRSIAVIGPNAKEARPTGGGSSYVEPFYAVSPLEGIQNRAGGGIRVEFAQGCYLGGPTNLFSIPASALRPPPGVEGAEGLLGQYFDNQELRGEPALSRRDAQVDFDWVGGGPADGFRTDNFSVRWSGRLVPPETGEYVLGVTSDDGTRLWLDGQLLIDDWRDHGAETRSARVRLEAGREYSIRLEYYENRGLAVVRLGWLEPSRAQDIFAEAREVARRCDVAVVCVGTGPSLESEGFDRATLDLPQPQDDLIRAVVEANPRTIVAVVSGSACLMHRWIHRVPAVLQVWFAGQEAGNALAEILFGDVNPSGRLPITLPYNNYQLPPFNNDYETIAEGRGYRYYDRTRMEPLFPFGHGLSYTTFRYGDLKVEPQIIAAGQKARITISVTNTGARDGDEVVQLYVRYPEGDVERPVKELKGFQRLSIPAGQTRQAVFELSSEDLAWYNPDAKRFVVQPGEYELLAAASARDIRASAKLTAR